MNKTILDRQRKIRHVINTCRSFSVNGDPEIVGLINRYLIILTASYVELGVQQACYEFCLRCSNPRVTQFVDKIIRYRNSFGCDKIRDVLVDFGIDSKKFDLAFHQTERDSIDALKTLRDQIAHGNDNGTGYITIEKYYETIVDFPERLRDILLDNPGKSHNNSSIRKKK